MNEIALRGFSCMLSADTECFVLAYSLRYILQVLTLAETSFDIFFPYVYGFVLDSCMKIDFMSFASKSGEEYVWYSLLRNSSHFIWKLKTIFIFVFTRWQISYDIVRMKSNIWDLWHFYKKKFHNDWDFQLFISMWYLWMYTYF